MERRFTIQEEPIAVDVLRRKRPEYGTCGGYVTFEGVVRGENEGKTVSRLFYECYESLARKEMDAILDEVQRRYPVHFAEAVHRVGELQIGDVAVFIQIYAPHRKEAFEACQFVIDTLKHTVPIWKKEFYTDGSTSWPMCDGCHGDHKE